MIVSAMRKVKSTIPTGCWDDGPAPFIPISLQGRHRSHELWRRWSRLRYSHLAVRAAAASPLLSRVWPQQFGPGAGVRPRVPSTDRRWPGYQAATGPAPEAWAAAGVDDPNDFGASSMVGIRLAFERSPPQALLSPLSGAELGTGVRSWMPPGVARLPKALFRAAKRVPRWHGPTTPVGQRCHEPSLCIEPASRIPALQPDDGFGCPGLLLRDPNVTGDLSVAFPVGFLVGDDRIIHCRLNCADSVSRPRGNRMVAGRW